MVFSSPGARSTKRSWLRTVEVAFDWLVGRAGPFSAMLAGGGIKGGTVYGKSDERAHYVEEEGSSVEDLNATIAHALGLKLEEIHYSPSGRPFKVAHDGKVLTKLLV